MAPLIETPQLNQAQAISHEDKVINIVFSKDEATWQSMLYELVKQENMDPWDINVSLLVQKYIEMLNKLKEINFRISGKMVLAAAILLRIKSKRLVGEEIDELDRLMAREEEFEGFYDELEDDFKQHSESEYPELSPRTPQPRKRKVSIFDLVGALQKALEVRNRRILRRTPIRMQIPEKKTDISKLIKEIYERILSLFSNKKKVLFSELVASNSKEDKVLTFIPLLHLAHYDQRKIDLLQNEPFGEIEVVIKE